MQETDTWRISGTQEPLLTTLVVWLGMKASSMMLKAVEMPTQCEGQRNRHNVLTGQGKDVGITAPLIWDLTKGKHGKEKIILRHSRPSGKD